MHILLLSYVFPPYSAPGAMRLARFARHFVENGGRVTVVAPALVEYENCPKGRSVDFSLLEGLPEEVRIVRTPPVIPWNARRFLDRHNLGLLWRAYYSPDFYVAWCAAAVQAARQVASRDPVDCIYTSSNPYSVHLAGLELQKTLRKPWLAEFRDPWTQDPGRGYATYFDFKRQERMERAVLTAADRVVVNTPVAREQLLEKFTRLDPDKVFTVTNSFDPDEMQGLAGDGRPSSRDRLMLAHIGSLASPGPAMGEPARPGWKHVLRQSVKRLGNYVPYPCERYARSPWYVFQALHKIRRESPELAGQIELVFAGNISKYSARLDEQCRALGIRDMVRELGHLERGEALALLQRADALLLLCNTPLAEGRCPIVPAKTYEYLASGKPILALVPPGDAEDFVRDSGLGLVARPTDIDEIAARILELLKERQAGHVRRLNPDMIQRFSSRHLAERIWQELVQISASAPNRHPAGASC